MTAMGIAMVSSNLPTYRYSYHELISRPYPPHRRFPMQKRRDLRPETRTRLVFGARLRWVK